MIPSLLLLALLVVVIVVCALGYKKIQIEARRKFIRSYTFPPSIRAKLALKHTGLCESDANLVLQALRQYFLVCLNANAAHNNHAMGLPSRVVDDAWHEFILISRAYSAFCTKAFGTYLHHAPASTMAAPISDALGTTLAALNSVPWAKSAWATVAGIPLLFGIDRALNIRDGYFYDAVSVAALVRKRHDPAAGGSCGVVGNGANADGRESLGGDIGGSDGGDGGSCGGGCSS